MGYGYDYGYGYGAPSYFAGMSGIFSVLMVIAGIVAFVGSFVVFYILVAKPEGKAQELKQESGAGLLERLARFQKLIVGDVLRWFYLLLTLLVALEGVIITFYLFSLIGLSGWMFLMGILNIGFVLLIELALRVVYELRMLTVLIAKDTDAIHKILEHRYGTPQAPAQAPAQGGYAGAYVNPNPGMWVCPVCGNADNQGAFCKQCGTPRP